VVRFKNMGVVLWNVAVRLFIVGRLAPWCHNRAHYRCERGTMTATIWAARKAQGPPLRIEIGESRRGRLLGAMPSELLDSARKSVARL